MRGELEKHVKSCELKKVDKKCVKKIHENNKRKKYIYFHIMNVTQSNLLTKAQNFQADSFSALRPSFESFSITFKSRQFQMLYHSTHSGEHLWYLNLHGKNSTRN